MAEPTTVKVDLHVHSEHSDRPYSWFLRSARAAECYTAVDRVYQLATARGMSAVTLSDHDTIDGAVELCSRHPGNTFISVETSARFPEDGCVVHTIAVDITEAQHRELQRLRRSIYELVEYMDQQGIAYFWCHPLSQVNGRLTRSHLERCFLMFRALELRNGTRDVAHEQRLLELVAGFTPEHLAAWADRHPRVPRINLDGRYAFVGGSDDHGSLAIARAYTEYQGPATGAGVTAALRAGATVASGESGTSSTLAHNCYGVVAGFFQASGQLGSKAAALGGHRHDHDHQEVSDSLLRSLLEQRVRLGKAGASFDGMAEVGHTDAYQETLRTTAEAVLVGNWRDAIGKVVASVRVGRVADAADGLPALVKAFFLELPYILANRYHVRDRSGAHRFADELGGGGDRGPSGPSGGGRGPGPRVAIVTDTLDGTDGVALGLRRLVAAARRGGRDLMLIGPGQGELVEIRDEDGARVARIPGVYQHRLDEYPQYAWTVPHLPALMRVLCEAEVDLVQCSTPGPMGFAALLACRLSGIPVVGQYHTDVPEYALRLTGDPTAARMVEQIVGFFYRGMDHVLVPSEHVRELVVGLGVDGGRVRKVPRGVDLSLFRPDRRRGGAFARWGVDGPVVLYVGRLSREKGLDHLIDAFRQVGTDVPAARLVLVGDGPMRAALEAETDERCVFTGAIHGEALAELFASADVFVFPSETETFGNVVVEAQAAGLPVVVTDRGAARELVVDGVTGFVADARQPARFGDRMSRLLRDGELRARMGRAAAEHARRFDLARAVEGTLAEYARIIQALAAGPGRALGMVGSLIVLDVTSFFSSASGGIRTYYAAKARHLPARGVECHFVVPGERAATSAFEGGWLHRVPGPPLAGSPDYRRFGDWSALVKTLVDVDPDVIELGSHYVLPEVVVPIAHRVGRRRAVVGFYHADFPSTYVEPALRRAPSALRRAAMAGSWALVRHQHRRYAATLVGSRHVAGRLGEHGVPRVRWVGLGVDTDTFRPREVAGGDAARGDGPPVVAYVGRLSRDKEVGVLLDAADALHATTDARLVIAGTGPLGRAFAERAQRRPWLDFRGHVAPRAEVAALLREADVVIAPGRYESFSLTTAEALATGVPVVAAGEGGAHELVARSGGGLGFRAGDPAALVAVTGALLRLPASARAAMGARGRAHVVADHTWERVFDRVQRVYDDVARQARS